MEKHALLPPSIRNLYLSCGSKLFLMGEYGVLVEKPALLAAIAPRFELNSSSHSLDAKKFSTLFHTESPAGKLITESQSSIDSMFTFQDPHFGKGGFGSSTAEFLFAQKMISPDLSANEIWNHYRALHSDSETVPSGADLFIQLRGGVGKFLIKNNTASFLPLSTLNFDYRNFWVFSATHHKDRKVKTHEHLSEQKLKEEILPEIRQSTEYDFIIQKSEQALASGDATLFGKCMKDFSEFLNCLGLEQTATREERLILSELPAVAGVKGCGAKLSDLVLVLVKPEDACASPFDHAAVLSVAEKLNLKLVQKGIFPEEGLTHVTA